MKLGFGGDIFAFNRRVEATVQAHIREFGYGPTPGLVLDIARSGVDDQLLPHLFDGHSQPAVSAALLSDAGQQAQALARTGTTPEDALLNGAKHAIAAGSEPYRAWSQANGAELENFMKADKAFAQRAVPVLLSGEQAHYAGIVPASKSFLSRLVGKLALGAQQVATGLVIGPSILAERESVAAYHDIVDHPMSLLVGPKSSSPKTILEPNLVPHVTRTTEAMGRGVIQGVKRDIQSPSQNPGNVFLDALGLVTIGAGGIARIGAAGEALRAGEGLGAVAKAATRRPTAGVFGFHYGESTANLFLSENPAWRAVQKLLYSRLQNVADLRHEGALPAAALDAENGTAMLRTARALFHPLEAYPIERQIRAEWRSADRTLRAMRQTVVDPIGRAAHWSVRSSQISRMIPTIWKGLNDGEQKAIQVLLTDLEGGPLDQIGIHRDFHNSMIRLAVGDPAAHRAQLAALKLAEGVLSKDPRPQFTAALDAVRRVVDVQEAVKMNELGLLPQTAEGRVARAGEVFRREIIRPQTEAEAQAELDKLDQQYGDVIDNLAKAVNPHDNPQLVQLRRNYVNSRVGKGKFLGTKRQPTVANEARDIAESKLLDAIAKNPNDPVAVRAAELIRKRGDLRDLINARAEATMTGEAQPALGNVAEQHPTGEIPRRRAAAAIQSEINKLEGLLSAKHVEERAPHVAKYGSGAVAQKIGRLQRELADARAAPSPTRVNPESRYLPFVSAKRRVANTGGFWAPSRGPFGLPTPGTDPSLTHVFTGESIRAGDFRIDATNLATEAYGRAVRNAVVLNAWRRLHDAAVTEFREGYVPVRDRGHIPDALRTMLAKADHEPLSSEDAAQLHQGEINDLHQFLLPDPKKVAEDDPSLRWVHPRLFDDRRPTVRPHLIKRAFQGINELLRDTIIFAKPSYAVIGLANAGMNIIHEGWLAPLNVTKAINAEDIYGRDATRLMDGMHGDNQAMSMVPPGRVTKLSGAMARSWGVLVHRIFRRSAVIHELHRAGLTDEQIPEALNAHIEGRAPAELQAKITRASQGGKRAMVEFDNLTPFERESLRHYVFLYPWVKGSLVWSLRTILEHPIKSAVLNEIGQATDAAAPPEWKRAPRYLKEMGYIPIGTDANGNVIVENFQSVNTFSTLGQAMGIASGADALASILGPGADLALHEVTQRDRFGKAYKTPYLGPLTDSLLGLPQYAAVNRALQHDPTGKTLDITNLHALITRENQQAAGKTTKLPTFVPQGWAALWSLGIGGLHPRVLDKAAINAKFWRNAPADERHAHEVGLLNRMLDLQAGFVGKALPEKARDAADLAFDREYEYKQFAKDHGRSPTVKEKATITIDLLRQDGRITDQTAGQLTQKLDKTMSPDIEHFLSGVVDNYGGGLALKGWRQDVETVASFSKLDYYVTRGIHAGVIDQSYAGAANATPETLQKLGRQYLAYQKQITRLRDAMKGDQAGDRTVLMSQLRDFIDGHDTPVRIDGKTFPSLARLAVARLPQGQLDAHLRDVYLSGWDKLSSIDKQLAGKVYPAGLGPKISTAWAAYTTGLHDAIQQLPPDRQHLTAGQKLDVAKQIDNAYQLGGAFVRDYQFSLAPRSQRLAQLGFYRDAPASAKPTLSFLLAQARQIEIARKDKTANVSYLRDAWSAWLDQMAGKDRRSGLLGQDDDPVMAYLAPYLKRDPRFLDSWIER